MIYFILLFSSLIFAANIPNPLSLEEALKIGNNKSLELQKQKIIIANESLDLQALNNEFDLQAKLNLQLANKESYSKSMNNSHSFLYLEKTLFSQDKNLKINTNKQLIINNSHNITILQKEYKIKIMRSFFDVLLVDMQLEYALEKLAISAIRSNRVRDDFNIEHASEVDLLEKVYKTQFDVSQRIKLQTMQIQTRAKLAQLLGIKYEDRPDDLIVPDLDEYFKKELPEINKLKATAFKNNKKLQIIKQKIAITGKQILAIKNNYGITIKANAMLGKQSYFTEKNGNWRAGINLNIPIGNSNNSLEINKLRNKIKIYNIEAQEFEQELSQKIINYWLKIKELKQIKKSLTTELDYRDLYLELSRAKYEMELESDIGDAMANFTNTETNLKKIEFDLVIYIEELSLFIGKQL